MSKFTAGPWEAAVSDTHDKRLAVWADGGMAGATQVAILPPEFSSTKANAHLIASAPDMFRDLNEAANLIDFLSVHLEGRMGEGALMDMQVKAESWRETLAKAEGKS